MKKCKFLFPVLTSITLLVGCANAPKLSTKDSVATSESDSYQYLFEKLYNEHGIEVTNQELLLRVANYVLDNSDFWKERKEEELTKRVKEEFDNLYSSTYKEDGLFDEELLVKGLKEEGYKITVKDSSKTAYKETGVSDLLRHGSLYDKVTAAGKYDYSDYETKKKQEFTLDLLKEEYIRTQNGLDSDGEIKSSYYTDKKIRQVEYFCAPIENNEDRIELTEKFAAKINADNVANFSTTTIEELEDIWRLKKLEDLAKDFAAINKNAHEGVTTHNDKLPDTYKTAVNGYEEEYKDDEDYGYVDIFTDAGRTAIANAADEDNEKVTKEKVTSAKEKLNTYSNDGTTDIYEGYYLKQLEILAETYYTETTYATTSSDVINSTVTTAIKNFTDSDYVIDGSSSQGKCFISPNKNNSAIYKVSDSNTCYVIVASKLANNVWDETTEPEYIIEACKVLATSSSAVSNCWYFYLTKLHDEGKFEVNWEDLYDSLNETYSYGDD